MTSFISEHTIEYALVVQMTRILSNDYDRIIPIYLWLTREGNNSALASVADVQFKLIAVYPRRPKVVSPNEGPIFIKFNDSVLAAAKQHQLRGIPVFAGVPLVASLGSFQLDVKCAWYEVLGHELGNGDIHLELTLTCDLLEPILRGAPIRGPIDEEEIARVVADHSEVANWQQWVTNIRDARNASRDPTHMTFFWFGGTYKPFYLLLPIGT